MIKLTYHSKMRCIQRVFGIEKHKSTVFLFENEDKVSFELWRMLSESKLIYENFSYDNSTVNNYYLYEDYILITDHPSKILITLYKLKFNVEDIADTYLLNKHINSIYYNKNQIKHLRSRKSSQDLCSKSIELSIESLKAQINSLEIDLDESVEKARSFKRGEGSLKLENENIMRNIIKATDIVSDELNIREYSLR